MTHSLQIIALTGSAGTGKDTAADILVTHCGFTKLAFADALRAEVQAAFSVPAELLTRRDLKELSTEALSFLECTEMGFIGSLAHWDLSAGANLDRYWLMMPHTPRQILQWWGTEYRRRQRVTYWTEKVREHIAQLHLLDGRTRFVIADARFENEAHMIRAMGGVVWQITRDDIERVEGQHASATDGSKLNPSVVIDNSSSIHALREAMLCEWIALETQTDVEAVRITDPSLAGDSHQAQTFGALA